MSGTRPAAHRKRSAWHLLFLGMLTLSLLTNLAVAVKISVFDSNYPFRPICHGGRHVGMVALNEPMNDRFKDRMQLALWNSRRSDDRILRISYWEWLNEKEILWNTSRSIAEYVFERQKGIKRMTQETREKLQTARCKFIRKYALEEPKAE
ncbi:MAG: hypothetical protein ACTSWM_10750 [Alphaproteobacteria bacterium]